MIAETIALHQIFADETLRKALAEFFETQAADARKVCAEFMGHDLPNPDLARKYACYAAAYEEAMNRLKSYAQQV